MAPPSSTRANYQRLKERRRQARRKQLAQLIAISLMAAVAFGGIAALVVSIRGCSRSTTEQQSAAPPPKPAQKKPTSTSEPKLVLAREFRTAPWFMAVDSQRLYAGLPLSGSDALSTTQLTAYRFNEHKPAWETPLPASVQQIGIASNSLVAMESTPDGLIVHGFEPDTGKQAWQSPALAGEAQAGMDSRTLILGLADPAKARTSEAFRLVGYDADSGIKTWGPLKGNIKGGANACCGATQSVAMRCWEGFCAYNVHNSVGVVETGEGRNVRTYSGQNHIVAIQFDPSAKLLYLVTQASGANSYVLQRMGIGGGSPQSLLEFNSDSPDFLLLAEQGYVILAYHAAGSAGPQTKLVAVRRGESKPALAEALPGLATDVASLPGGSGELLLATCERFDANEQPLGRSTLYRVNLAEAQILELPGLGRPVLWITSLGTNTLLLSRGGGFLRGGGEIHRFDPETNKLRRVAQGQHAFLEPMLSPDSKTLLVSSYPLSYLLEGKGSLQALVFQ